MIVLYISQMKFTSLVYTVLIFQVKQLVEETEEEFGPVDILVNNAGVMYYTDMINKHQQEWDRQIDINCKVGKTINSILIPILASQW